MGKKKIAKGKNNHLMILFFAIQNNKGKASHKTMMIWLNHHVMLYELNFCNPKKSFNKDKGMLASSPYAIVNGLLKQNTPIGTKMRKTTQ